MFKVMVVGTPPPAVVWTRVKCPVLDPEVYKTRYDPRGKEHVLEVRETLLALWERRVAQEAERVGW